MTGPKQDREQGWEREHVQRVLDHHNAKYGAHVVIKGKTTEVYPHLKGQLRWDWVCYNTETGDEIAVEVKKLTDPKLEEKSKIMWQLLKEVQDNFSKSKQLSGTFSLFVDIPSYYYLPFNTRQNKQAFKRGLSQAIYRTAQRLELGEREDLRPQIVGQLPFALPDLPFIYLHKFSDEGNVLYKSSGITGFDSIPFDKPELEEFEQLVLRANEQLRRANTKDTLLVLIEEGYRPKDPSEVTEAFKNIDSASYSEIRHIYFIRGEEVTEIPLPTL